MGGGYCSEKGRQVSADMDCPWQGEMDNKKETNKQGNFDTDKHYEEKSSQVNGERMTEQVEVAEEGLQEDLIELRS